MEAIDHNKNLFICTRNIRICAVLARARVCAYVYVCVSVFPCSDLPDDFVINCSNEQFDIVSTHNG